MVLIFADASTGTRLVCHGSLREELQLALLCVGWADVQVCHGQYPGNVTSSATDQLRATRSVA
jgi:hypothetical protein